MKTCSRCNQYKALSEFHIRKRSSDGYKTACKACIKLETSKRYEEKAEHIKKVVNDYRIKNHEVVSKRKQEYHVKNKEKINNKTKRWMLANPDKCRVLNAKKRAKRNQAVPKWLTPEQKAQILTIYKNRPEGYHVDHIMPLKGKNSCGLHVPWNLQYLPADINIKKSNKV